MRVPVKSRASALGAYEMLLHWGPLEFRKDILSTRQQIFDDLREGLVELQDDVADDASFATLYHSRSLLDRAMVQYRIGGDLDGCTALLQKSREAFRSAHFATERSGRDLSQMPASSGSGRN